MMKSQWVAGAAVLGVCLAAPAARAENAPPPPPGAFPAAAAPGAPPPGNLPGTTRAGTAAPAKPVPLPGVTTVMVFPFDNVPGAGGPALGQALADAVERGMDASKVYSTVKFSPTSLLVQRAALENPTVMNPAIAGVIDPVKGMVDPARAQQIALRTGMQALLLGSIEEYTYDKATNKVTMVATAQVLNSQTGEPLRTAGVTGTATGTAGTDETTIAQAAATDVASRLLTGLAVPPPVVPPKPKHARRAPPDQAQEGAHRHVPGWLPASVLLGIIVGAVR